MRAERSERASRFLPAPFWLLSFSSPSSPAPFRAFSPRPASTIWLSSLIPSVLPFFSILLVGNDFLAFFFGSSAFHSHQPGSSPNILGLVLWTNQHTLFLSLIKRLSRTTVSRDFFSWIVTPKRKGKKDWKAISTRIICHHRNCARLLQPSPVSFITKRSSNRKSMPVLHS